MKLAPHHSPRRLPLLAAALLLAASAWADPPPKPSFWAKGGAATRVKPPAAARRPASRPAGDAQLGQVTIKDAAGKIADTAEIEKALATSTDVQAVDLPLETMLDQIAQRHKIGIHIDRNALEKTGVQPDAQITARLTGVKLRAALKLILADLDLTYLIDGGLLVITTLEQADRQLTAKLYPVEDLACHTTPWGDNRTDLDGLSEIITGCVKPKSWGSDDGLPAFAPRGALLIPQTQVVHEEVARLLEALRQARQALPLLTAPAECRPASGLPAKLVFGLEENEAVEKALEQPVDIHCVDTPLEDLLDALEKERHIPIWLDRKRLEEVGVGGDTPVSADFKGVSLDTALRHILQSHAMCHEAVDGVLLVSPEKEARQQLITAVYPVADLVLPPGVSPDVFQPDFAPLIEALQSSVDPTSWSSLGGPGQLMPFPHAAALVVLQTSSNHRKVLQLLADLRRLPPAKIWPRPHELRPPEAKPQPNSAATGGTTKPNEKSQPPDKPGTTAKGMGGGF